MPSLSKSTIDDFCYICLSAHDLWRTSKIIFSDPKTVNILQKSKSPYYLGLIQTTFHKQLLLQIGKIHDPAEQRGRKNLTIDYILTNGNWDTKTLKALSDIHEKLNPMAHTVKKARNRILAHHDLKTIQKRTPMGGFKSETAENYFKNLEEFVSLARHKVTGQGFAFNNAMLYNDARIFLSLIVEDTKAWRKKGWGDVL